MKDKRMLLAVLAQLEREKIVSIPQLARLLSASEEDVYEALEVLVFAYDAASIRLDLHDTYASLETHGTDRLLRLTPTETDALIDALMDTGFSPEDELVRSLIDAKGVFGDAASDHGPRMQTIGMRDSADIAQVVAAACEDDERHLLEIKYQGEADDSARDRVVEPVRIFSKDAHRYLQAYCRDVEGWRSFRMDRIEEARTLDERFEPRNDVPSIEGVFDGMTMQAHIRLDADEELPKWPYAHVEDTLDDGSRLLAIPWSGSYWLPRHIAALMGAALPLDPPELVEACKEVVGELLGD